MTLHSVLPFIYIVCMQATTTSLSGPTCHAEEEQTSPETHIMKNKHISVGRQKKNVIVENYLHVITKWSESDNYYKHPSTQLLFGISCHLNLVSE